MAIVYSIVVIAFVCCIILTPFVISMCKKHGLVDVPKDSRRVHSKPMPRCGGIAIFVSSMVAMFIYYIITKDVESIAFNRQFYGYLIGAILIFIMGIIDDIFTLKARYKAIFEFTAIFIVFMFGVRPAEMISNFLDALDERRELKKQAKVSRRELERQNRMKIEPEKVNIAVEEEPHKETRRERKLREKEEAKRKALELDDQITINLNNDNISKAIPFTSSSIVLYSVTISSFCRVGLSSFTSNAFFSNKSNLG